MKIKSSERGLTFSFAPTGTWRPGNHYIYDIQDGSIVIKRADAGLKVSRKRTGTKIKSLFDLRSKEIRKHISNADYLDIQIEEDIIQICCVKTSPVINCASGLVDIREYITTCSTISIPSNLCEGMYAKAAGSEYHQFTIEELLGAGMEMDDSDIVKTERELKQAYDVISLFSGTGMLDYPFHKDQAFKIRFACDLDFAACKTYRENIGAHIRCGSIQDFRGDEYVKAQVLIGGPPCTAFTNANRRKRLASHPDYLLVEEYVRFLQENDSDIFVIENVPQFISANDGIMLKYIREELPDYEISATVVKDCDIGGYTTRKRAIIIGSRIGAVQLPDLKVSVPKTVSMALAKVDPKWFNYLDISGSSMKTKEYMHQVPPGGNYKNIKEMAHKNRHSSIYRRLHPDEPSPTLVNWRKTLLTHPVHDRILSVAEAAALSGLESDFKFMGTLGERQQQCGNGVPQAIGRFIKKYVKKALDRFYNPLINLYPMEVRSC